MNTKIIWITTTSLIALASCGQNNGAVIYSVDPSKYATSTCEELQAESAKQKEIIDKSNSSAGNANKAGVAGIAVGALVSPLLGAAIAAGAQNQQAQSNVTAQKANAEYQAIATALTQHGCVAAE